MPCAAASSSIAEDVARCWRSSAAAGARRRSPSRRGPPGWREVGSESTLAGWASDLFSLASAAAVTWAIMKPELSPARRVRNGGRPRHAGVDQHRDAPLGDRADLGDRERQRVGGERHRLGVEVAARTMRLAAVVGEDQRVVGDARWPRAEHAARRGAAGRGRRPSPAAGSAGCTGPAPVVAVEVRARGSRCRRAARGSSARRRSARAGRAARGCAGRTGVSLPLAASTVSAPATSAAASTGSKAKRPCSASAVETCVPLMQREAFLGREHRAARGRRRAARRAAGTRSPSTAHLAVADQRERQVRERREVARGADRALRRDERQRARRCATRERSRRRPPRARPSGRARGSPP